MISIRSFHLVFALIPTVLISCASPPKVDMGRAPAATTPDDYPAIFEQWSREIRVIPFNGLENILTARATYMSFHFREAYVETLSRALHASPADEEALRRSEMETLDKGHEIFVSLMSAVKDCDELDAEDGPWTIRLKNDQGKEVAPSSVEEIKKVKPNHIQYFHFNPAFRKAYKLTFPLTAADGSPIISQSTRYFELTFATAYGRGVARWEIAGK